MTLLRRLWAAVARHRTVMLFAGALGFGAMAVVGMRNYIGERVAQERERLQPRHEMIELVVAQRDLARGETVGPDTMAVREVPREFAPGGAVHPERFEALIGSRHGVPMRSGEPLLPGLLAGGEAPGFARRLGPGIRALTVAVDEVNSLSGMLQPGDRIDLMLSVRPQPTSGAVEPEITRTLMQNVHVLATGRQVRPVGDTTVGRSFTTITVEVDPGQAQQLVVAQRSGRLTAMLRNPDDRQRVSERMLDVNALLGLPRRPLPPAAPPPPPRAAGVQVIVGGRGAIGADAGSAPVAVPASPVGAAAPAPLVPNQAPPDAAAFAAAPRRPDVPVGSRTRPLPAADPLTLPADAMPPGGLSPEAVPVVPPSLIR